MRTCRRLGIRTVAVYSAADANARHVVEADEALLIGAAPAAESYLVGAAIIRAAQRSGAEAIHPGFGFLAENADFARACADAGLLFIGPSAAAIAAMGNKRAAKMQMAAAGVPIVPGYNGEAQDDATLSHEAERIGLPLMIKAAAGGGGKGMRLVHDLADFAAALASVQRESQAAFGAAEVILERAIIAPRHIEIQIFGDTHGNLLHLGERECSIQRRHQKIIEESPSLAVDAELRAAMGAAAIAAGRTIGYTNAGTVEFLLDAAHNFYFLEMNTRLQVEHPITEAVTGLDLVEWQIRIAEGEPLPLTQAQIQWHGHAIEARVYAEDVAQDFAPAVGPVLLWREPSGAGVRVESGIRSGDEVSVYYDPMLAKIIAHGPDRTTALRRLARALETTTLLGCTNNLAFLRRLVLHPAHVAGELSTAFLARYGEELGVGDGEQRAESRKQKANQEAASGNQELAVGIRRETMDSIHFLALVAATLVQWMDTGRSTTDGYWRNSPNAPTRFRYTLDDTPIELLLHPANHDQQSTRVQWVAVSPFAMLAEGAVSWQVVNDHTLSIVLEDHRQTVIFARREADWWVQIRGVVVRFRSLALLPEPRRTVAEGGSLRAPMPGVVSAVLVEVGETVQAGTPLLRLEAMKMEHTIRAAGAGTVAALYCATGETVQADTILIALNDNDQ